MARVFIAQMKATCSVFRHGVYSTKHGADCGSEGNHRIAMTSLSDVVSARPSRSVVSDLYIRYSEWLRVMVRRRGGGEATDDIVQETYLQISRSLPDEHIRYPQAYLLKVAQNVTRSMVRNDRGAIYVGSARANPMVCDAASCDQFESLLLKDVIAALPDRYRNVFVSSRFAGLSYEEIARSQGISVKAVERRMARALALCAARMGD